MQCNLRKGVKKLSRDNKKITSGYEKQEKKTSDEQ